MGVVSGAGSSTSPAASWAGARVTAMAPAVVNRAAISSASPAVALALTRIQGISLVERGKGRPLESRSDAALSSLVLGGVPPLENPKQTRP